MDTVAAATQAGKSEVGAGGGTGRSQDKQGTKKLLYISPQFLLDRLTRQEERWVSWPPPPLPIAHYASKLEVILIEQAAWRLSHSKVTRKPPLLDELTSLRQRESAPAILGLY